MRKEGPEVPVRRVDLLNIFFCYELYVQKALFYLYGNRHIDRT